MKKKRHAEKTARKQQVGIPFKPGESGNPKGRPKGSTKLAKLGEYIREFLGKDHPEAKVLSAKVGFPISSRLDVLLLRMELKDPKTLLEFAYGKAIATHEIIGDSEKPLKIIVKHAHEVSAGN